MKRPSKPMTIISTPTGTSEWFKYFNGSTGRRSGKTYSHYEDCMRYILGHWKIVDEPKRWPLRVGRQIEHVASGNVYELISSFTPFGSQKKSAWTAKLLSKGHKSKIPVKIPSVLLNLHIFKDFVTIPSKAEKILYERKRNDNNG